MPEIELYHVCHGHYAPGDIKPAGTYWNGLIKAGHSASSDPLGEILREDIRKQFYPSLPSREKSSFAFETHEDAQLFRNKFRVGAIIYKVSFVNQSAPRHRVTWSAFQPDSPYPLANQAHDFWSGKMLYSGNIEVFAESGLIIL